MAVTKGKEHKYMKVVLGVEDKCEAENPLLAASLLRELRFPNASVDVVNVIRFAPYSDWGAEFAMSASTFDDLDKAIRDGAERLVSRIAAQVRHGKTALPEEADPEYVRGVVRRENSITEGLLSYATEANTDLIAVDGPHSGLLASFLTGSVARSLVCDSHPTSLLLAKKPALSHRTPTPKVPATTARVECDSAPLSTKGLRAVLATDHSAYADRCVDELLRLAPGGISHLTVLTAYPEVELEAIGTVLPDLTIEPQSVICKMLWERNEEVLHRLEPLLKSDDATSESRVVGLPVNDAIAQSMKETNADLLILGARGHGFLERLSLGSVALHHAMAAPYSLLILRAR
jgi:nucleotide-binding universal stress UspA family protein